MLNKRVIAFTSIAVNYIPLARVLGRSIKRFHPEWHLVLALADCKPGWLNINNEPFDEVISISDIDIGNNSSWIFSHDIEELCTAIKPFMMSSLLCRDGVYACLYFDPDMVLFDRLDDLLENFSDADILLTPHQTEPEPTRSGIIDNEVGSLRHGIYNLGFLGVANTSTGKALLSWWRERVFEFCLARVDLHLWTDQKWFNHVPVFFDRVITLKSQRFNVAPWNLSRRHLTRSSNGQYLINGKPLGFYHFSGFNSGDHSVQASRYAPDNYDVAHLLLWYSNQLEIERHSITKTPWAYEKYSNGESIRWIHRLIYRYRQDLQSAFPDPFDANGFYKWISTQGEVEYGELIHFIEDRKLDIPEIPKAEWLKWFPPEFSSSISSRKSQKIYGVSQTMNIHSLGKRQGTVTKVIRLAAMSIKSSEQRKTIWRAAKYVYKTHGMRGVLSKLRSH